MSTGRITKFHLQRCEVITNCSVSSRVSNLELRCDVNCFIDLFYYVEFTRTTSRESCHDQQASELFVGCQATIQREKPTTVSNTNQLTDNHLYLPAEKPAQSKKFEKFTKHCLSLIGSFHTNELRIERVYKVAESSLCATACTM